MLWRVCSLKRFLSIPLVLGVVFADVRDGFFVGGGFGVSNESLSSKSKPPLPEVKQMGPIYNPATVMDLSKGLKKDLQEALQMLQNLNHMVVGVSKANQSFDKLSSMNLSDLNGMPALQAKITETIQELQTIIDTSGLDSHNQAAMSAFSAVFTTLKSLQQELALEVKNYNEALTSQEQEYNTKKDAYEKDMDIYQQEVQRYTNARNSLANAINSLQQAIAKSGTNPLPTQTFSESVKTIYEDLGTLAPLDPKVGQAQYQKDIEEGFANVVQGKALENAGETDFQDAIKKIDPGFPTIDFNQFIALMAWFRAQEHAVQGSNNPSGLEKILSGLYATDFQVLQATLGNATDTIPTAQQVINEPEFKTPDTLRFNYKNFSTPIQDATHKIESIPNVSITEPVQIKPSLAPLAKSINRSMGFFSNVGYHMNFLVGYQHFFSQHLGFSLDAFLGYGYIRSPIYSRLSFFKNLQDIQIDVGGNLIYDFNVPKNYQSPLFYGMFAGVQGGSTNFVLGAGDKSLWRASYNLDVDLGFRFQFSTNIIKWGVDIPLIPHELNWQVDSTHLQLDQNAKDIGIFMTYEKLIF